MARGDSAARRAHQQVEVVGHERVGVHLDAGALRGLAEHLEEELAVLVLLEDRGAAGAAMHDVVPGAREVGASFARHSPR
ncbi:MAG: hypothetical protein U1F43_22905 [Myxococcota bacterium]